MSFQKRENPSSVRRALVDIWQSGKRGSAAGLTIFGIIKLTDLMNAQSLSHEPLTNTQAVLSSIIITIAYGLLHYVRTKGEK